LTFPCEIAYGRAWDGTHFPSQQEAVIEKRSNFTPLEVAQVALGCVEEKKAKNVRVLDISSQTILADYFIICTADNERQARAISSLIQMELKSRGLLPYGTETPQDAQWGLLDYGTVVVHIFQPDARSFYDLDNYWCDAPEVKIEAVKPGTLAAKQPEVA
jgi:ribosome-associated protein